MTDIGVKANELMGLGILAGPAGLISSMDDGGNIGLVTLSTSSSAGASNTTTLQAALNTAGVAGGGSVCISTPGTYLLNRSAVDDPGQSSVTYCISINYDNIDFIIGPGVILKLADNQQIDRAGTGTGPVNIITAKNRSNVRIYGGGRITGNTAGQTGWTTTGSESSRWSQQAHGCIVYFHGTDYANGNTNIIIKDLYLDDHFSNPVQVDYATNVTYENLRTKNCGEGPQMNQVTWARFYRVVYEDTTGVSVGDGTEFSQCVDCFYDNCLVQTTGSGTLGGSGLDMYRSVRISVTNSRFVNCPQGAIDAASTETSGTDLVVDASLNTKVTSASYTFIANDLGKMLKIAKATNWTAGLYRITAVASGAATLDRSPAATTTTGGLWMKDMVDAAVISNIVADRCAANAFAGSIGDSSWVNCEALGCAIPFYLVATANQPTKRDMYGVNQLTNFRASNCTSAATIADHRSINLSNCSFEYSTATGGLQMQYLGKYNTHYIREAGDVSNQMSLWSFNGITSSNTNSWVLYWKLTNSGSTRTVNIYKDSAGSNEVARGTLVGDGVITLSQQNSSGVSGQVTVAYTGDDTTVSANTLTLITPSPHIVWVGGHCKNNAAYGILVDGQSNPQFAPHGLISGVIMSGNVTGDFITGINSGITSGLNIINHEHRVQGAADLAVDAANNKLVTSASYTFTTADVGRAVRISAGTGWILGDYVIVSISGAGAVLHDTPAELSATAGTFTIRGTGASIGSGAYYIDVNNQAMLVGRRANGTYDEVLRLDSTPHIVIAPTLQLDITQTGNAGTFNTSGILTTNNRLVSSNSFNAFTIATVTGTHNMTAAEVAVRIPSGGAFTCTLLAAPINQMNHIFYNYGGGTVTIARNGKTINGASSDYSLLTGTKVHMIYDSASNDWMAM